MVKSYLKTSTFDLSEAWKAIKHLVINQLKDVQRLQASQQIRIPIDISGVIFEAVRGWVSHQALRKVYEQYQLLLKPSFKAICSQSFTSSYGLPCAHTLKELKEQKQSLQLKHFHAHWYLKRHIAQPRPLLEPRPVRQTIQRTQPITSTRREPSGFELVQARK